MKTKKDGATKGSRRSGEVQQMQPEQPQPNWGIRILKENRGGLVGGAEGNLASQFSRFAKRHCHLMAERLSVSVALARRENHRGSEKIRSGDQDKKEGKNKATKTGSKTTSGNEGGAGPVNGGSSGLTRAFAF
ncbi:hypothetical protein Tcan_01845 [Toxocara canis]|uniref:Uncharacterized protein n=1 Tax=Toxocara canis TaxID=6265 RepID=A0A0B2V5F3_TOXCA|nr:hypothetical protein Tcan_01845 [Toxocara canis]